MNSLCHTKGYADGRYVLPPLPYDVSELSPLVSAETMILHHDKHHAAYVAGANKAADELDAICRASEKFEFAADATRRLAFNLGGHMLHSLYWYNMSPYAGGSPAGALRDKIEESFGSVHSFRHLFAAIATGVPGSGWAVMGVDPLSKKLTIAEVCRHQDGVEPGFIPLLACDVWEHAYYLTWKNDRKGYVERFVEHINWSFVEKLYLTVL